MSTTTSPSLELRPHPRLAMARPARARLTKAPDTGFLRTADAWIADQADRWVAVPPLEYVENQHNSLLTRAREVQARVLTLLAGFEQTGAERYRQAVLDHVRLMGSWRYWSWLARRSGSDSPTAISPNSTSS